jgi:membrane protein implicated in regulation of membrane protease activity
MRHRSVILIMLLVVCLFGMIPLFLFASVSRQESSVSTVVETTSSVQAGPITVGVILVNAADSYGWAGGDYAETDINGDRVFVYDKLNATARPNVRLQDVVSGMLERGAQAIFISPGVVPGEITVGEQYPNTVFITNLAARAEVEALLPSLALSVSEGGSAPAVAVTQPTSSTTGRGPVNVLIVLVVLVLISAVFVSSRWRNLTFRPERRSAKKKRARAGLHGKALAIEEAARGRVTNFEVLGELPPLLHELSTYVNGDTYFDESFAIELNGAFLGQCGMGPSEAISRYDREKIAAFEVWLFDKNDIKTVTSVLMSEHAYDDPTLKTRLQSKGELLLAEPDAAAVLETKTLHVQVRVLDMQYGFSDTLPPRSFFEHIVVEIAAWQKA